MLMVEITRLMVYGTIGLVLLVIISPIVMYNRLVSVRNHCDEAWSNVDTELQRRYELIPNLVSTVKGYAAHERQLLERVTQARNRAFSNTGAVSSQAVDEGQFEVVLDKLIARVEAYPALLANGNFLELQAELANTENRIQAARRFFNGNVRESNTKVRHFPSNLIAKLGGFGLRDYFEPDNPQVRNPVSIPGETF